MKSTSLQAWEAITATRKISERQRQVIQILRHDGPSTGAEISQRAGVPGLWKRCSELKTMGVIREAGTRSCRVTGFNATVWALVVSDQPDMFEGVAA